MSQRYIIKTDDSGLRVYGGNYDFLKYQGSEAIIHGPAETGKTFAVCLKIHLCACKYPNSNIAIVRKTQTSCYNTIVKTFTDKILGRDFSDWPCVPYGGLNRPERFIYNNGSSILIGGMDRESKILSAEFDLVAVNQSEELSIGDWETITTRTTGRAGNMPYSQTIGDANPSYPQHWMYHRDSIRLFYSRHEENPALFDQVTGEITEQGKRTMAVLDALTGVRYQRLRLGVKAQAEGAIYTEYDESKHLIYADNLPEFKRFIASIDWGYTHAGVISVWGIDGDGAMYLVAQYYHTLRTDDWWLNRALALNTEYGKFEALPCDPSQPAYIAKFKAAGLNAIPANNDVLPGINAVKTRLKGGRIFFVRDSLREQDGELITKRMPTRTEDEIPGYIWASTTKEQPVKENDHGCDAMRYAVAYLDLTEKTPPPASAIADDTGIDYYKRERQTIWQKKGRR